ncbi:Rho GTPase activating protein 22 [Mycena chlorophos]|uniref:Rho GTPase activating protein 22 n=1 Tax=Mycena chlorophos TaxID=658473 RepID=A0A8H6WQG6_MYCCL|nr:Rho GTPase activating protein 22 [Mycena chlorophos]
MASTRVSLKPKAGHCFKTTTAANEKVFVNICYDDALPPPPDENTDAIQRALRGEQTSQDAWFIPVVVSEGRPDTDKAGKKCLVFDCIFHPSVRSLSLRDPLFKTFIQELSLQRIEAQTSLVLSRQVATPNIASKGKLEPRTALIPSALPPSRKPLIEEIDAPPPKGILKPTTDAPGKAATPPATWSWSKMAESGTIEISVGMPSLTRELVRRATVDVEAKRVIVVAPPLKLDLNLGASDAEIAATVPNAQAALMLKRERELNVEAAYAEWRLAEKTLVDSAPQPPPTPSSGKTAPLGFLARPSKWFTRSTSASRVGGLSPAADDSPRPSTSSITGAQRKPKISRPTDPRPILDAEGYMGVPGSRSVLDLTRPSLSLASPPAKSSLDLRIPPSPGSPRQGPYGQPVYATGDLRNASRRPWSKSADDLRMTGASPVPPNGIKQSASVGAGQVNANRANTEQLRVDTQLRFVDKVAAYRNNSAGSGRNRADSLGPAAAPGTGSITGAPLTQAPTSISSEVGPMPVPFYARKRTDSERSRRSGRSTTGDGSPGSTPPSVNSQMAWPSMQDDPPPNSSPTVSVSVSAPLLDGAAHGSTSASGALPAPAFNNGPAHTRSHSFTPKLSSRLAASPARKGSAGELEIPEAKDRERRGLFHFGGSPARASPSDNGHLAPPHIILEPASNTELPAIRNTLLVPDAASNDGKRASQIVYASGFINRLVAPALSDPRSWKPFKMEVRGTKLMLHKPPNDRMLGVRELFASGIVEDDEEPPSAIEDEVPRTGSVGRKKRAYWGRGRHPALGVAGNDLSAMFNDGRTASLRRRIEKGTMEALIHEVVFATVLLPNAEDAWRDFALAVLLCVPLLSGRARAETELLRCASYFVTGAPSDESRARVAWIVDQYLRLHGPPIDQQAWDAFCTDTIPDAHFPSIQPSSGMPTSLSTQAMFTPSPMLPQGSPELTGSTFSPRPDGGGERMVGLLDALGVRNPVNSPSPGSPRPPPKSGLRMPLAALETEGLSRGVLLAIDANILARSLTLFHRAVLEQAPENPTVALVYTEVDDAALFGCDSDPHWLTKFVLLQVLSPETGPQSAGLGVVDGQPSTSRTHSRSEIIAVWARVGELCRSAGDECSWRAICAALCSPPISRLEKVWRRVDALAVAAVEGWARQEGEGCHVQQPRVTPFGGDIRQRFRDEMEAARAPGSEEGADQVLLLPPMSRALDRFEGFRKDFLLCPRRSQVSLDDVGEELMIMVSFWRQQCAQGGGNTGLAAKFARVEQFMSLSLVAEPRRKGLFEPHYWARAAQISPYASLIPLLFPEVFPTSTLVERASLLRGRVLSDTDPRHLLLDPNQVPPAARKDLGGLPGLNQTGTVIPVYNGEVLLTVWHGSGDSTTASSRPSSRLPSRPPSSVVGDAADVTISRAPSIRVKPGTSQGLDRKTSLARRNSLPSPAQRRTFIVAEPSSERPLRVRVLAGTLNWLVDILVHGLRNVSVSVADDNGEMSLREGKTRELVVDQAEFSKIWWNVFRSLVTPLVFFELLRKIYLQARPQGAVPSVAEYLYAAGSRTEVLDVIKDWLVRGCGAQDMLDDPQLLIAVTAFLQSPDDHALPAGPNSTDPGVEQAWSTLSDVCAQLRRTFHSYTSRPPAPFPSIPPLPNPAANGQRSRLQNQTREPPNIDQLDPEELVDNLDAMACAAFSNVTDDDLFVAADLLEVQTADRIGWFLTNPPNEDVVDIQNMYSYLQEIEPTPLISELGQDSLYRLLPPGIRSCIRAYVIIRKWTVAQLVAPRLGLRTRQNRMELILRAIEVARRRVLPAYATSPQAVVDFPSPRSFVEAILTSAVLSIESRIHVRPWTNIAMSRGTQCDSIASLLLSQPSPQPASSRQLTLDVGWLLERMLEIIAAPDVVESAQQDAQSLISFDKRRHLYNLINSMRRGGLREDVTRRAFERLNNIEKDDLERRLPPARRMVQPFQKTVAVQMEKNKRDRALRSRLHKERVQEQTRIDKREDQLTKAMQKQAPPTPQQKHQRSKKSMSAFLHFIRPISSAFGSDHSFHASSPKRTPQELDFVPSGKPSLVVSLVDSRVTQFINNDRSFVFQVDSEDGGHYILQAVNKREMFKWLESINRVTQTTAKRRLTYLGTPKPQIADHLQGGPAASSHDPHAGEYSQIHGVFLTDLCIPVFGVALPFILRREVGNVEVPPGTIPSIINRCLSEIEARGLTEVGIYRLAGSVSTVNACRAAFNRGDDPIDDGTDIHVVCDLVKIWFRVLPEPFFPPSQYHEVIQATQLENLDDRLITIRKSVHSLPQANFDLLKRMAEHLDRVADLEESNQMTAESLSIVFSPGLLRPPQENFAMVLANMGHAHKLMKALITHFHAIFDEDEDLEGDNDDDELVDDVELSDDLRRSLDDVVEDEEPPTITAELDQSPLDFSTANHLLAS